MHPRISKTLASLLFVVIGMPGSAQDQDTVVWKEDVKGWDILVDRTVDNGCFMYAGYEKGTVLRAQFNPSDDVFQFIVANNDWKSLEAGKLYEVSVQFGKLDPWTGDASGFVFSGGLPALVVDVSFEDGKAKAFIQEFMQMTGVRVTYSGVEIANLSLRGTYAAMQEVISCQATMNEQPAGNQEDPFLGSSKNKSDPFE